MGDNLKIGDLIKCEYDHYTGVGYAKVIKITNININSVSAILST